MLDVKAESNLYSAWENDHRTIVDNYEAGSQRVQLTITEYIEKLPNVLVLQLNRT